MVKKRGIQQRGLDLVFGGMPAKTDKAEVLAPARIERNIVLYLKEGLNPANRDFTKYPNEIHKIIREKLEEESEGILYMYMWWQSWGFGRNFCRISHLTVVKDTLIGSKRTAQRAMSGLVSKRFVVKGLDEGNERDVTQAGGLYRVLTPQEIVQGMTEEGINLREIPEDGVVMLAIAKMAIPCDSFSSIETKGDSSGIVKMASGQIGYSQNGHSQDGHTGIAKMTIANMAIPNEKPDSTMSEERYSQNGYSHFGHPLKDRLFKDSLSQEEIISRFYEGIGHTKIPKAKRESAERDFQKLTSEGFTPEDIQFAVKWSLENVKEKMYDFSIVCHTIGEAMAAKEKADALQKQRADEENKALLEREEYERIQEENQRLNSYKETMNADDRASLRERALAEIRKIPEIKEDFISDMLISSKENEILKKDIGTVVKDPKDK